MLGVISAVDGIEWCRVPLDARSAAMSVDGRIVFEVYAGALRMFDLWTEREVIGFTPSNGICTAVAASSDGKTLAILSRRLTPIADIKRVRAEDLVQCLSDPESRARTAAEFYRYSDRFRPLHSATYDKATGDTKVKLAAALKKTEETGSASAAEVQRDVVLHGKARDIRVSDSPRKVAGGCERIQPQRGSNCGALANGSGQVTGAGLP